MPYNAKLDWNAESDVTEDDFIRIEQGIKDVTTTADQNSASIAVLQVEVKSMKDAMFNDFTYNLWVEDFETLADIAITDGWYDATNKRLVL